MKTLNIIETYIINTILLITFSFIAAVIPASLISAALDGSASTFAIACASISITLIVLFLLYEKYDKARA